MCTIIGALGSSIPEKNTFLVARDTMTHRGPDDSGYFYSEEDNIALGHRRLSIIDLSKAGRQPMESSDGRYVLIFNGEIYNFKELRKELEDTYRFRTNTDTEAILAAYSKWGVDVPKHLDGMFSFVLWDREKKILFAARDRLGIKPFYYSYNNDTFYFASEIKGILAMMQNKERKLNKQGFLDYLSYRYPLGKNTMFEGIFSLDPGQYICVGESEPPEPKTYWDLPVVCDKKEIEEDDVVLKTEELLKKIIRSHMISDVPVGAYLSGGLDSSLVVALMAEETDKPIKTFSVGFTEEDYNEFPYARLVSEKYKTDHKEIILSEKDYLDLLPEVISYKDAPLGIPNEVSLYVLSKELKKDISVVVSGEGADELFGGYGRIFKSGYDFDRIQNGSYHHDKTLKKNLLDKYKTLHYKSISDFFLQQYSYFDVREKNSILNREVFNLNDENILNRNFFESYFAKASTICPEEQFMYVFEKIHLLEPMQRLDNATMAKSVEARVPFIDHRLVEHVSALPMKYKIKWRSKNDEKTGEKLNSDQISEVYDTTKYILRKISEKYLPKEILERKKLGFPVPLNSWMNRKLLNYARATLLSKEAKSYNLYNRTELERFLSDSEKDKKNGANIWMLLNVELWMKEYNITV